ncbi:hypothetical protein Tco_0610120 [Tanacetum coccineum]
MLRSMFGGFEVRLVVACCGIAVCSAMHNAIMEVGGSYRAPMLVLGSYIHWKSQIRRYIATRPNHDLINHCTDHGPYEFKMVTHLATEETKTFSAQAKRIGLETYSSVSDEKKKLIDAEADQFVTIIKKGQDLKIVSYHKLFDILKQHQNEVNEIRAERLAKNVNPLVLVAANQQQSVYYPQAKPNYLPPTSSTRSHAATGRKRKEISKVPSPPSKSEHEVVSNEEETQRDKDIHKAMALISKTIKNIYKPTNKDLRLSSNTKYKNVDNSPRTDRRTMNDRQTRLGFNVPTANDLGIQLGNANQQSRNWKRIILYMAKIHEVIPTANEATGPVFDKEPLEQGASNTTPNSSDMSNNEREVE